MSTKLTAGRTLGVVYLLTALPAAFSITGVPALFVVNGDAAATARRISDGLDLYRFGVVTDVFGQMMWILLVVGLYRLLKDVDGTWATFLVISASVIVPMGFATLLTQLVPLVFLGGSDAFTAIPTAQRDALVLASLTLRGYATFAASAFWGLWLFPFGMLVRRSGRFPKILGTLLFIAGVAYLVASFAAIALPGQRQVVALAASPFEALGELTMIGWLLVKGVGRRDAVVPPVPLAGLA